MLRCRIFGHRPRFWAEDATLRWSCARGCGAGDGAKEYDTAAQARRYAAAFDREDRDDLGRRAPFLGLFPLRVWRSLHDRAMRGRDRRA